MQNESIVEMIKPYAKVVLTWTIGWFIAALLVYAIISMFVYGALKQDEINRANDCAFAKDKPFAQEWYLAHCSIN